MVTVRPEQPEDIGPIFDVNAAAFERPDEAKLVDALRGRVEPFISLVAADGGHVVGHALFTPVTVYADGVEEPLDIAAVGMGPVAVLPGRQRRGIGSQLVRAGLEACRAAARDLVFVVGHPTYYPRFGFAPARPLGLRWEHDVPDDVFMVAELTPCALERCRGVVRYHPAFAGV
jgi:putative acetyltransferase